VSARPPRPATGPTSIQQTQGRDRWSRPGVAVTLAVAVAIGVLVAALVARDTRNGSPTLDGTGERPAEAVSVADVIAGTDGLATLGVLLERTGLTEVLDGDGPHTVFAPTDAAFAALGLDRETAGSEDPGQFVAALLHHVVPGAIAAADLADGGTLRTANGGGDRLAVAVDDAGAVTIDGVPVVIADLVADNGVVHVVDAVLIPAG
jgi:uncharacterized surface protein with fasciclin (FAS1) repeats